MSATSLKTIIGESVGDSRLNEDDRLARETDPHYKKFLGKRIVFKDKRGKEHIGIAQFIGVNPLTNQFQVTASKAPIWPVDPKSIQFAKPSGPIEKGNPAKYHIE